MLQDGDEVNVPQIRVLALNLRVPQIYACLQQTYQLGGKGSYLLSFPPMPLESN